MYKQQDVCNESYLLGDHERWFYDQETGILSFSNQGKDGWEMAAISAYLLNGLGVYRTPNEEETIFHFKLLTSVEFLDEQELERVKMNRITERTSE